MDYEAWTFPEAVQKALGNKPPFILNIAEGRKIDQELVSRRIADLKRIRNECPLLLLFDSPGGDVESGRLLIAHLEMLKVPIVSLAVGPVNSMALVIYLSMPKKTRFALPGSTFLAHFASSQPGFYGQVGVKAKEIAGLEKDAAMRLFSFQWDQAIRSDAMLRDAIKDSLGKHVTWKGVTISVDEFMSYDKSIPVEMAWKMGFVSKIV